jgi:hypothetical protein
MIKTFGKITLATILAAMVAGVPLRVSADDKATNSVAATAKSKATRFNGKLAAVDSTAKTITIENKTKEKRTFEITADTKIMKDGKPATLSDGVVGEEVYGTCATGADGKMAAKTIRFGKPAEKGTAPAPAPAK